MAWPALTLRVAFASDPMDANPSYSDITHDVRRVIIDRGRNHDLDRMRAGTMRLVLKNFQGNYWPYNTTGLYTPNVLPGKRFNLYAVYDAVTYHLFTGFVDDWNPSWLQEIGGQLPIVQPLCIDLTNNLAATEINGAGYAQELSGTRVGNVLDEISWPAGARDLDNGQSTMQATGAMEAVNAMSHLYTVQQSELGNVWVAGDGDVQFEDRHHRLKAPHNAALAVFGDAVGENYYHGMDPSYRAADIKNDIRFTRLSGTQQTADDAASKTAFGKRSLTRQNLLMTTDGEVLDQAQYLLKRYKDAVLRNRQLDILPERDPGNLWPKILGYDISDRITVRRTEASIDRDYFIEGVKHDINLAGRTWKTSWQLSEADSQSYWALQVAGLGELGETTYLSY